MESLQAGEDFIPNLLCLFLEKMITVKNSEVTIISLGQAIMQAARPRGFISPLQIGLGVQMHRQLGSRFMIDTLNKNGVLLFLFRSSEI